MCSRLHCHSDCSVCPELPPGRRAAGHLPAHSILPGLGLVDGTLWRPDVGGALSNQRSSQQMLVSDEMVRMRCCSNVVFAQVSKCDRWLFFFPLSPRFLFSLERRTCTTFSTHKFSSLTPTFTLFITYNVQRLYTFQKPHIWHSWNLLVVQFD